MGHQDFGTFISFESRYVKLRAVVVKCRWLLCRPIFWSNGSTDFAEIFMSCSCTMGHQDFGIFIAVESRYVKLRAVVVKCR